MALLSEQLEGALVVEAVGWDGKKVGTNYRLQWSDATWAIEELPVKGGPRKVRHAELMNPFYTARSWGNADAVMPQNILAKAKIRPDDTYDSVKNSIHTAMEAGVAEVVAKNEKLSWLKLNPWYESSRGAVMVTPEGADKLVAKGKDFSLTCEFDKFSVFSPNSTMQHAPDGDPHYTEIHQKSAGAARKLYNLVKKDPKAFANVSWSEITDFLRKAGVAYDYSFSTWS